ncbi:hypothetical protein ABEB36_001722 [Hypothenemus hampei]|uniref:Ubiquitin-like domain-containing protein n=1 Tax=Hypothenemus hampei TaxID=57062 RepID=A0ABD1FIN4_HYPHA
MECIGNNSNNVDNVVDNRHSETCTKDNKSDETNSDKVSEDLSDESHSELKIPKAEPCENLDIKVIYNKKKYDVSAPSSLLISEFKKQLQDLLGVPDSMQKLMFKGLLQDNQTISSAGITKGSKVMLVGSTLNDILAVSSISKQEVAEMEKASTVKEPLCKQKLHRKVLDKGVPEDVMPGIKNLKESLPPVPLSGMLNKQGGKVRLTFKLENDQLWLGTKERTEKLPMASIKSVISEPIEGHEEYHIMGLQLGPTEASRYWIYWVPAQYVDAIKDCVLGKWQFF